MGWGTRNSFLSCLILNRMNFPPLLSLNSGPCRDDDLRKAIAMSEEEESKRRRQLEDSNATALFDDNLQMCVE